MRRSAALVLGCVLMLALPASAHAAGLRAGVGRADITPPTGYFMMGWVRSDALVTGQNTRLFARVIVLEENGHKVALVAEDLNGIAGGMLADAADMDKDIGFSQENVLDSASHTHAAPTGYYNFGTYNTVFMTAGTPTTFNTAADPQLYTFMVKRLALAIRRANANLGPAEAAWGQTELLGLTQNRSLEAHLADHGILVDPGQGSVSMDPMGYAHTIDPEVNVLRVDRVARHHRHYPIGVWSTFADHGTVNKYQFHFYNEDHHAAAMQGVESALRRAGHVPRGQDVVNAYGNTDEGDQSAGLTRSGPAASDYVGKVEAQKMLVAWRAAGRSLSRMPQLESRWTRICFCGQSTDAGNVDSRAVVGQPLLTGSEEGRGPLYDETHVSFEGNHLPAGIGPQGDKVPVVPDAGGTTPKAVPLMALRIGDKMIVSVPGEMTEEMGRRVRSTVLGAVSPAGVTGVVISGLANEYLSYFTTPEEYDRQHYEGGSTLYGRASSEVLKAALTDLATALVQGKPAPEAYPYDPRNGLAPTAAPFPDGTDHASVQEQPRATPRLDRAVFAWQGAPKGYDRPLDRPFVLVRRLVGRRHHPKRWLTVDSDLGLRMLWTVDDNGGYRAEWEVPLSAPRGSYDFVVTANHYRLQSRPFHVAPSTALSLRPAPAGAGRLGVTLGYPAAVVNSDLTYRPAVANAGRVTFIVGRRHVTVRRPAHGSVFSIAAPAGGPVSVAMSGARDRWGNANHDALTLRP